MMWHLLWTPGKSISPSPIKTKLTERVEMEFAAFNIFNHVQLGDLGPLTLNYASGAMVENRVTNFEDPGDFGIITAPVNFNSNNDNAQRRNAASSAASVHASIQVLI